MPENCCARRQLQRDGAAGDFYCVNCGATVPGSRVPAAAWWAGVLAEDELRDAAFMGSTVRVIEENGE